MKVQRQTILQNSKLSAMYPNYDYFDSYKGECISQRKITSIDLGRAFFSSSPVWVDKLFSLRNKIVSLFGLKTTSSNLDRTSLKEFDFQVGKQIGLFKVFALTEKEIILGEDDKHLDFRVSLLVESKEEKQFVNIMTSVKFKNIFGRLYFLPVKPFHQLIVPTMLKGILRKIE
ncbi:MAG: DUF2867 domain-containing protein [Leptospiraceae bacterium]|jgi:hypothetical protein|nr:DUF2867 domain-containing protein [Leptospiraceae bacterium]